MHAIKLEGSKEIITSLVRLVDVMNQNPDYAFKYQVKINGENSSIDITAQRPEHYYALGIASHQLLKTALKIK